MTTRTPAKFLLVMLLVSSACFGGFSSAQEASPTTSQLPTELPTSRTENERPNIIVFLVDDMGWQDTSVPFHSEETELNRRYQTPNMELLARRGMKFTQAYACSVCSPTRISLMTGLNAARHRVTNWTLNKNSTNDAKHPKLIMPEWNVNGLSPEPGVEHTVHAKSIPAYLSEVGYQTIHVGKAHFGANGTPAADPTAIGFEVNIAGHAAGGPGSFLGTDNFGKGVWAVPGLEKYHGKDIFLTEALTLEANREIDQSVSEGEPFFLYMAHYAVHVPFSPDSRFYQAYRDRGIDHTESMYAALIEGMDKSLGDILANVERHGLTENTIVIFMSDNGGLSASGRGGEKHRHNQPLSSGKGSAYEGGIRVPMIVCQPGVTKPESVCNQPIMIEDFFPTILEMAGVDEINQIGGVVDGISFTNLLNGDEDKSRDERPLVWHYPNNWGPSGPGIGPTSSIRKGDWKLIYYHDDQDFELFQIARDISEKNNLAEKNSNVRDKLSKELGRLLRERDAQMPLVKSTGKPVPFPDEIIQVD